MVRIIRISKIIAIIFVSLTVVLMATSLVMRDRVADVVLMRLNDKINTKFDFSSVNFSFLSKFPKASLELKDVVILSSPGFDKNSFQTINTDTLLSSENLSIEFRINDILNGNYKIESIGIKNGDLILLTDSSGKVNYELITSAETPSGNSPILDLSKITISNLSVRYNNLATNINIVGVVSRGTLKTWISGREIDFSADADATIDSLRIAYLNVANPFDAAISTGLIKNEEGVSIEYGNIDMNKNRLSINGTIISDNYLDLTIEGNNIDISRAKEYLPHDFMNKVNDYSIDGVMELKGSFEGVANRTTIPRIKVDFLLDNSYIEHKLSGRTINGMMIRGSYSNGTMMCGETSSLKIEDIKGAIENYIFRGSVNIQNFDNPNISLLVDGHGEAGDIASFFNLRDVTSTTGNIDINIRAKGVYDKNHEYKISDLISFDPAISIITDSFNLKIREDWLILEQAYGKLTITEDIVVENFRAIYHGHSFEINGESRNLTSWLLGEKITVTSDIDFGTDKLLPEVLFPSLMVPKTEIKALDFPADMVIDLRFRIDSFAFKEIRSENITGSISYKPTLLNIKNLEADLFDGKTKTTGFIVKNSDMSIMARGNFDLNGVDIRKGFNVFNNFGQDYLKAENIEGKLSGGLSVLVSMDSLFKPNLKTLMVEGDYLINNGALINFDPIMKLSGFIELSELENIRFNTLHNEIVIRNNYIYIPKMEIESSAANLSIDGKHGFNNDYEYHIKVLLSEILSNKFNRNKPVNTEFGAIQDDGLGRTSILLAIDNKGVRYDIKAVGTQIRNEIREERQEIREIFNEEYGWFENNLGKEDTLTTIENEVSTTPRFSITWDDSPAEKESDPFPEENNENGILRNLFGKNR